MKVKFRKTAFYRCMILLVVGVLMMTSVGLVRAKSISISYQEEVVFFKKSKDFID